MHFVNIENKRRALLGYRIQVISMIIWCSCSLYMSLNDAIIQINLCQSLAGSLRSNTFQIYPQSEDLSQIGNKFLDGDYILTETKMYHPNILQKILRQPGRTECYMAHIVIENNMVVKISGRPRKIPADSMYELVYAWNQIRFR